MGMVNSLIGGAGQASAYDAQKRMALAQGQAAQNAKYAQATSENEADKKRLMQSAQNMARMAGNQRRAVGAARAVRGASGFTEAGSGAAQEAQADAAYAQRMADMARSASVESENSRNRQIALRREGDAAMRAAEAEAAQYRSLARRTRTGMWVSGISSALGAIGGAVGGVQGAQAANASAAAFNEANAAGIAAGSQHAMGMQSLWQGGLMGGLHGANGAGSMANAANPFLARYASQGWEQEFWKLAGLGGGK